MPENLKKASSKRFRPKVPLEHRKRIVKACTSCRLHKRRCVFVSPDRCRNCAKTNSNCVFESEQNTPSTGASHRAGRRIDHEDVSARFNHLYPEIDLQPHHTAQLMDLLMESNRLSNAEVTPTGENKQFKTTLADSAARNHEGGDAIAHQDFLVSATEAVSQTERPDFSLENSPFYPSNEYTEYEDILIQRVIKNFPSQAEAEPLISTFFFYAEANWYYLDEITFRSQLSALYNTGLTTPVANVEFVCLALTVLAMGSQFAHLYQDSPSSNVDGVNGEQTEIPGCRLFQHAQHLIPRMITRPSLEGVLSCLLAALYILPIQNTNVCYTYLGLALRIAICLGLHRKSPSTSLSRVSELRNRVFWTTYAIKRRVAISLGYPETLQYKEINCPFPQRQTDLDPPGLFRAERLVAYTKLTLLLNEAIESRVLDRSATEKIQNELLAWQRELPSELQTLDGAPVRLNAHLQLHYCMVWTYISRAALIRRVRAFLHNRERGNSDGGPSPEIEALSNSCVQHAEKILDLIDLLKRRRQLARFSHTDFHCCSSATIIILLGSILNPSLSSYSRVRTAMDALHFMACGSDFARSTLKHVDNFQALVNKALASMSQQGGFSIGDVDVQYTQASTEFPPLDQPHTGNDMHGLDHTHQPHCTTLQERDLDHSGYGGALFDDIGALLVDCSFHDQHLLGFNGLCSGATPD
ncbi:hypothetical protein FE257_009319 [Aspergillus nanangensis]|uniref:Zn(2)-C6 fungal-type domain-containing protein n=1 Tax=Aspergillus nanangensis TaxID=2582783 RepID=A0AAD4CK63_ASPNN|nr:hypothetical protein FE257_009319 [Aspergillus nanangensis]